MLLSKTQSYEEKQPYPQAPNEAFTRRFDLRRQFLHERHQGDGRNRG